MTVTVTAVDVHGNVESRFYLIRHQQTSGSAWRGEDALHASPRAAPPTGRTPRRIR